MRESIHSSFQGSPLEPLDTDKTTEAEIYSREILELN